MFRYYIIFISLFVTATAIDAQGVADSLFARGEYGMAAVEYEREVYLASTRQGLRESLLKKAECYKLMGRYDRAAETLGRMEPSIDIVGQLVLNLYLSGQYAKAADVVEQQIMYEDTVSSDILLAYTLILNEMYRYDESRQKALSLATAIDSDLIRQVEVIYADVPKLKSVKTAQWLSIVPGLGHLYAGYPFEALSSFIINTAALGFGVWQVFEKCYFTAYFGGAGLLASTYPGNFRSAEKHVLKHNFRVCDTFNRKCKSELIRLFSSSVVER